MAALAGHLSERRYRLTGVGAFETVFRDGRRRDGDRLQVVFMPARSTPGRAGFVIGKKALPLAVDRNRVRRILRESLRRHRLQLAAFDVIVRLKRGCPRAEMPSLALEVQRLLAGLPSFPNPAP